MEAGGVEVEVGVMRVLLVDDSPVDRRVAQLLLSSNSCAGSFHVIAVDSAKKAMEFLGLKDGGGKEEQAIDMVLTDYCMPEMTGYDLLKAIKALNPLKPIPVIVMSSEDEPQRISRCLNAGAEDFIVKPLQSKDVQRLRNCSTAARPSSKGGAAPCEAAAVAKRNSNKPLCCRPPRSPPPRRRPDGERTSPESPWCCTRRAWSSRSSCRSCSSSSCWHTPCCCWASSCTDGHRVAAAPSPCGAPEQQAAKPATVQCSCAVLGTNRRLMVQVQRSAAAAAAAPSRARASRKR